MFTNFLIQWLYFKRVSLYVNDFFDIFFEFIRASKLTKIYIIWKSYERGRRNMWLLIDNQIS